MPAKLTEKQTNNTINQVQVHCSLIYLYFCGSHKAAQSQSARKAVVPLQEKKNSHFVLQVAEEPRITLNARQSKYPVIFQQDHCEGGWLLHQNGDAGVSPSLVLPLWRRCVFLCLCPACPYHHAERRKMQREVLFMQDSSISKQPEENSDPSLFYALCWWCTGFCPWWLVIWSDLATVEPLLTTHGCVLMPSKG